MITTVILNMIFIVIHRKQGVLRDTGLNRILLFCLGLILLYFSYYFATCTIYLEYSIKYLTKNIGGSLILMIFYIDVTLAYELGIPCQFQDDDITTSKFSLVISFCKESLSSSGSKLNLNNDNNLLPSSTGGSLDSVRNVLAKTNPIMEPTSSGLNMENTLNKEKQYSSSLDNGINQYGLNQKTKKGLFLLGKEKDRACSNHSFTNVSVSSVEEISKEMMKLKILENLKRNIKNTHALFIKISILYFLVVISTLLSVIFYAFDENELKQSDSGEWYYSYNLELVNLFFDAFEVVFIFFILFKGKSILEYDCVFNCTLSIVYIVIIEIVLGPSVRNNNNNNNNNNG
ncbi:hypothetical protein PIROE2DRAFT_18168 [Piromyces sp. E2]|nr:hypothetical protein PIROE2DRAFT_18168 [Piromyces sp. E2]|eukprot:OUM56991.1 hypothetical protein PIROE2DRAFT_18168 [Piromyces sp. E2]